MLKKIILLLIFIFSFQQVSSQINKNRKKIPATRVTNPPEIEGFLTDEAWESAPIASDFFEFRPDNGKKVSPEYQTTVRVIYDDDAIYISALMLDPIPSEIPQEFASRDNFSIADFFLVTINPNDDGQNPFEFIVQTTNNQLDAKISNGNEDFNWSAVWESATSINDKGWAVEMKIPYRALRFANAQVQSWGFNFHRRLEKLNEQHTWNFIDNTVGNFTQYDGLVEDFRNIKPPTRLLFYPYASALADTFDGETSYDWSVGMDLKYGITENFTLDATLIPDFSQAGFDNVELNLGPFEQQFSEQRQFFTEGTELFSKGNLFYSRRIGGSPIDQFRNERSNDSNFINGIKTNDRIIDAPSKVQLLNAVKISGRTKNGLGIGFFNAITGKENAIVERIERRIIGNDTISKVNQYESVINPFSNYNILVVDQQFNQNSTVTLINTNVTRNGRFRDANVTALDWHVETKNSKYNIDGSVKMSTISDDVNNPNTGYTFDNSFGYDFGNYFWELGYNFENKDYNPNDLGILFSNNEQAIYGSLGYRILQPKGYFNNYSFNFFNNAMFQHFSGIYTGYQAGLQFNSQLKSRTGIGFNLNYSSEQRDYFEPRQGSTSGVYFLKPERKNFSFYISTNYQKKFAIDFRSNFSNYTNNPKHEYGFRISPRYRFSNQFSMIYNVNFSDTLNDQGFVTFDGNRNSIFGQRNRRNITNSLTGKYSFSTLSSLSLSFRHYRGTVRYEEQFYDLNSDGTLAPNTYAANENVNFNTWNLDVSYIWQLAPGSQLIAFYRNSIFNSNDNSDIGFVDNLENLFDQPNQHLFSLRLVYFIDYNQIKKLI